VVFASLQTLFCATMLLVREAETGSAGEALTP